MKLRIIQTIQKKTHKPACCITAMSLLALACLPAMAGAADKADKHYNQAGFFDIHVCNWPGRPLFFMPLFSTKRFREVREIEVSYPDGSKLASLDLSRYRTISDKKSPEKRVYINQINVPTGAQEGWYSARVTLASGEVFEASDYVVISELLRATGHAPGNGQEVAAPPEKLTWEPIPGAGFYQVFIRDQWDDDKLIFTSKLLDKPELILPAGLIEHGGLYSWKIHARDVNEDILLGDFNHGSISKPVTFSVN